MSLTFWTTLLMVTSATEAGHKFLEANCTHVLGPYWIMEGDVDFLRDSGVEFEHIDEGAVSSLGGLSQEELLTVCRQAYSFKIPTGLAIEEDEIRRVLDQQEEMALAAPNLCIKTVKRCYTRLRLAFSSALTITVPGGEK